MNTRDEADVINFKATAVLFRDKPPSIWRSWYLTPSTSVIVSDAPFVFPGTFVCAGGAGPSHTDRCHYVKWWFFSFLASMSILIEAWRKWRFNCLWRFLVRSLSSYSHYVKQCMSLTRLSPLSSLPDLDFPSHLDSVLPTLRCKGKTGRGGLSAQTNFNW